MWRAPNNASKWQVGFNSAFKGLKPNVPQMSVATLGFKSLILQRLTLCVCGNVSNPFF